MEDPSATSLTSSLWASLNSWFTSTVFFVLLNLMIATILFTSNLPDNNQPTTNQQQQQEQEQDQKKNPNHQPQIARSPSLLHRLKSFNLYPHKPQNESGQNTTHYQQHPLEVAASQYVFNQPLEYQHFDFDSTTSDQIHRTSDTETRVENVTADYDFAQIRHESDIDTHTSYDFDPTRNQTRGDTGFDFDPTRQEMQDSKAFDFDPTREDTGFGFDPNRPDEERTDEFQSLDEVYSKLKGGGHDRTKSDGSIKTKPPSAKMKKSASLKVGFSHLEEEEEIVEARRPATVKVRKSAVRVVDDDDVEVDSRADDFINKFKNDLKLQRMESIIRTKGATNRGAGM